MTEFDGFQRSLRLRWLLPVISMTLVTALSSSARAQSIWYVNAGSIAPTTGTSWSTAFNDLDSALLLAQVGDQIWVADGVYRPRILSNPQEVRSATFTVPAGVYLHGGFAGNETSLSQRLGSFEATELSGDLGVLNDPRDDAYHVVTLYAQSPSGTPPTFIDGFLITHGHANGNPGVDQAGAGISSLGNKPRITNCTFRFNKASNGSALCVTSGILYISKCTFESNTATDSGGAMLVQTAAGLVYNSTFRNNTAANAGGAILLGRQLGTTRVVFQNCLFHDNHAINGGAVFLEGRIGAHQVGMGQGLWINCTFAYNVATGSGGGLNAATGAGGPAVSTLQNCIVWNNRAASSPGLFGPHSVSFSDVQDLTSNSSGNIRADPLFINRNGSPRNLRLDTGSPAIGAGSVPLLVSDYFDFDGDGDKEEFVSLDLDFAVRTKGDAVDMGAYEH